MYEPKYLPKVHMACSSDMLRPAMQNVYVKDGIATATDGHIIVRVKMERYMTEKNLRNLDGIQIPKKIWMLMTQSKEINVNDKAYPEIFMRIGDSWKDSLMYASHSDHDDFPDYSRVLEYYLRAPSEKTNNMRFNPDKLQKIKSACGIKGYDGLDFFFYGERRGFLVCPMPGNSYSSDFIAVCMPMGNNEYITKNSTEFPAYHNHREVLPLLTEKEMDFNEILKELQSKGESDEEEK